MAYFVFRIAAANRPELIDTFEDYRAAKQAARSLRCELGGSGDHHGIRMMFAADEAAARRLLAEKREPRPLGEE